jgi:hypothetical protein
MFKHNYTFKLVYIEEAHAVDEWPIESSRFNEGRGAVHIVQPKTLDERIVIAEQFKRDFSVDLDILVDDGEFMKLYNPWPIRYYVVRGDKIDYISYPKDCSYSLEDLREYLIQNANRV